MAPSRVEPTFAGLGYSDVSAAVPMVRLAEQHDAPETATVAEEVPIAFVYNGRSHVVVMATPADFEDLAVGFSLTECVIESSAEIERIDVVHASHGVELQVQIPAARADALSSRARGMSMRTGCGLCGVETIGDALRIPATLPHTLTISRDALWRAGEALGARQSINNTTNAVHAAAWADARGELQVVREDVGRHNALDKVLGALARAGTAAHRGFIVVTSRASYEMVQKSAVCGVELLAAISRPTALAIRFALASDATLVGLLRGHTANVYAGHHRLT